MLRLLLILAVFASVLHGRPTHNEATENSQRNEAPSPVDLINSEIEKIQEKKGIESGPPASPQIFLRRSFLDILGRPPTIEEQDRFADKTLDELQPLVCNYLVQHKDYAKYWSIVWKYWLMRPNRDAGSQVDDNELDFENFYLDLYTDFKHSGHRIDHTVWNLLTGVEEQGKGFASWYMGQIRNKADENKQYPDFVPLTSKVSRMFTASRVSCVQCHDDLTHGTLEQQDFWDLNAFYKDLFADDDEEGADLFLDRLNQGPNITFEDPEKERHEATPRWKDHRATKDIPLHEQLAGFILDSDEFSAAIVNRYWQQLFGFGLNYPELYDEIDLESNSGLMPLLKNLSSEFENARFQPRKLLNWMCNSKAYSRDSTIPEGKREEYNYYSYMLPKPMTEEQLVWTFSHLTKKNKMLNRYEDDDSQGYLDDLTDDFFPLVVEEGKYRVGENRRKLPFEMNQSLAFQNSREFRGHIYSEIASQLYAEGKKINGFNQHYDDQAKKKSVSDEQIIDSLFRSVLARAPRRNEFNQARLMLEQYNSNDDWERDFLYRTFNLLSNSFSTQVHEGTKVAGYLANVDNPQYSTSLIEGQLGRFSYNADIFEYLKELDQLNGENENHVSKIPRIEAAYQRYKKLRGERAPEPWSEMDLVIKAFYEDGFRDEEEKATVDAIVRVLRRDLHRAYKQRLIRGDKLHTVLEDLAWAMANSTEFLIIP